MTEAEERLIQAARNWSETYHPRMFLSPVGIREAKLYLALISLRVRNDEVLTNGERQILKATRDYLEKVR